MKYRRFIKPLIITCAVIAALFLVGLIGTPYLIDLGLERWIASQGPEIGQVENIDFNPFTGRLSMDNLVVETQSGRTLNISHAYLQFSWKQLFKKQLYLSELVLRDTFMLVDHLEESGLRVGGLILSELLGSQKKSDAPGWEVGIGVFELQDARIEYDTKEFVATYSIDKYSLSGLETWDKEKPVDMQLAGRINESPIRVKAEVKPLAAVKSWKGNIILENVALELFAKLEGLQKYAPSGALDLDLDLDVQMHEDAAISLAAAGKVTVKQLLGRYEEYRLRQEQIAWQGSITGKRTEEEGMKLVVDGQLTGSGLEIDDRATSLHVMLGALNWQGKAEVNQQKEDISVIMNAGMDLNGIKADDRKNDIGLLGLEELKLSGIVISGLDDILVEQIDLQNLRLAEKRNGKAKDGKEKIQPLLQTAMIQVSKTSLQDTTHVSIDSVRLQDFAVDIHRDQEGNWQLMPPLPEPPEIRPVQPTPEPETAAGEARPMQFSIGSLLADGNNFIRFADESLHRPFSTTLKVSELELGDINSAGTGPSSRFIIKGQVGDYGEVEFDGTAKLAEKPITLALKGTIDALHMVPFSSYTSQIIGYNVNNGQMDAEITLDINKGEMDGNFDLRMRNFEVVQADPGKTPEIDNQMDVPLGSALAMLRNKKDEISLDLKLQGDIQNPEFGIQDAINKALAKAMKFATLSYLKYTLQPFGTYIAIAEVIGKAGKEISKVGLDPVMFAAAEIALDETASQYLEKVKEVLTNRPKLRIELCGKAVSKDRFALTERRKAAQKKEDERGGVKQETAEEEITVPDEVLLDFARERAKLVKEWLVTQHSIDHQRIYLCLPEIDETPDKEPYVELRLD
jgi:hypothetical protein